MMTLEKFLNKNNVYPNLDGYHYMIDAVRIVKKLLKENKTIYLTKEIYPQVAKIYNTTWNKVERSIRHAIGKLPIGLLHNIGFNRRPTNGEFITYMACNYDLEKVR